MKTESKYEKIVFVTGSLCDGGAEKVLSILASGCAEMGHDVTLIVIRNKKIVYPVSEKVNIIQLKDKKRFKELYRINQIRKILIEKGKCTIIPFVPVVTLYTIISNIGLGNYLIFSERGNPKSSILFSKSSWKDKVANLLLRKFKFFKIANWLVFQTPDAQKYYGKNILNKSSIIPNPLDIERLPNRFKGNRDKRIVAAGRFSKEKNFPMLIEGFSKFYKIHPDYKLTIYGEGIEMAYYNELLEKYNIKEVVSFPGFSSNLADEIKNAAVYVSTSNHEGISNSMLEALGMGIPTIVTDCPVGGSRMFVHTDINGILIPMEDVDSLVNALSKIIDDAEYALRISVEAEKIKKLLDSKTICKLWIDIIKRKENVI